MMLARHAEDLLWMGRYLERAEQTSRLIDVTYHAALEAGSARSSGDIWGDLAEALGVDDEALAEDVERTLILDRESSASIRTTIALARQNARSTREWLSVEVWESINDLHLTLQRADADTAAADGHPYALLRTVKAGCQAITGAALASMPRSTGYRFYLTGVMLERAMFSARVLAVWHRRLATSDQRQVYAEWQKLLRTLSAHEAFLRVHKATFEIESVVGFLLQSGSFPRSVLYGLAAVEHELEEISDGDIGRSARKAIGRLRADVQFCDLAQMNRDDLADLLARTEEGVGAAAVIIESDYFRPARQADEDVTAEPTPV